MSESEKLSVAGLLYVMLRRKLNRTIDVEWMLHDEGYAKEIMKLARQQGVAELTHYADRLDELMFGRIVALPSAPVRQEKTEAEVTLNDQAGEAALASQYVGSLR